MKISLSNFFSLSLLTAVFLTLYTNAPNALRAMVYGSAIIAIILFSALLLIRYGTITFGSSLILDRVQAFVSSVAVFLVAIAVLLCMLG